jgi:hypothetical protein
MRHVTLTDSPWAVLVCAPDLLCAAVILVAVVIGSQHEEVAQRNVLLVAAEESDGDSGVCGTILTALSWALIICTLPFSLCVCFKV